MSRRRVVVTGLGLIAPCGIGKEAFWRSSLEARSRIERIRRFDPTGYRCQVAGQVEGFEARDWLDTKTQNQTDRSVHMAFACCEMAVADAGLELDGEDATQIGMYFANQFGGMEFAEPELYAQTFLGPQRVSAYQAIAWFYAAAQGQWSIARGILGFGKTLVGDRAGGAMALAMGALAIRQGHAQVMLAGGFEAPVVPYVWLIHQTSGLLSEHRQPPEKAYRPFDAERSGLVLGEGSAILVLEERDRAFARGARIYGEVLGYALGQESVESPLALASASRLAGILRAGLAEARIEPEEIDHVLAEGLGTPEADGEEIAALEQVFGALPRRPSVSAPKSMIGHTLAAAGAIDVAWAALMLEHGVVLPTVQLDRVAPPSRLDFITEAPRDDPPANVLCLSRASGGGVACLVLGHGKE